jgi:hypothetical protein
MARATLMSLDDRRWLVEDGRRAVLLDDEPAYVSGYRNEFATVQRKDGKGGKVEFAWATVERILSSHRTFRS